MRKATALHRPRSNDRTLPVLDDQCLVALKALGEETRARIVGLLIGQPMGVGEISRRLDVSPYNVSKHLRILREAGLLQVERHGRERLYALPDELKRPGALDLGCCSFQFETRNGDRD